MDRSVCPVLILIFRHAFLTPSETTSWAALALALARCGLCVYIYIYVISPVCVCISIYLISSVNERGRIGNTGPSRPELLVLLCSETN